MKKIIFAITAVLIFSLLGGCQNKSEQCQIAATTLPVYTFTADLCEGTNLEVCQIVTQNVSCLHDYTMQSSQMRAIESSEVLIISGGGLEEFIGDVLQTKDTVIDASENITLHCAEEDHDHSHEHSHDQDPHIWLSPENAKIMAQNICDGLTRQYPQHAEIFQNNLKILAEKLDLLQAYGEEELSDLSCRRLITFHDGFSYLAEAFDLTILKAIEEDSGSEASAAELKELIMLVNEYDLPAIFVETNGSVSSANTISSETGAKLYSLDMAMSETNYFDAMYHNIDTLKDALK